ncbi:MAG: lipopolysaccharide export system permease protein [Gammaproteobacteria bacterium]|jgi:lipopolysaccharide export system permease protein
MNKLNRYVSNTIRSSILMVLFILLGFYSIAEIIDEVDLIEGNYTFSSVLKFVFYSIPGNVFDLLPFSALVGSLFGLGTLANNSELVVIRSAGVSTRRIVWMVMRPTIVIMLFAVLVAEYIAPVTENIAQSDRAIAMHKSDNIVNKEGLWHREGNNFMHFNVVQPNGILYGVTIYSFDDKRRLLETLFAERAIYQADHWILEDFSISHLRSDSVEVSSGFSKPWDTDLTPVLLNFLILDPIDLSIEGLWEYSNYREQQGLNIGQYRLALWKKILQPLSTISLVLIAISFIFGPLREVTMGFRVFIGVLFGVVFRTVQDMMSPASLVYGFEPLYASLLPILICLIIGTWFLRRAK